MEKPPAHLLRALRQSFECSRTMMNRLPANSTMTPKNSNGDLVLASLWLKSKKKLHIRLCHFQKLGLVSLRVCDDLREIKSFFSCWAACNMASNAAARCRSSFILARRLFPRTPIAPAVSGRVISETNPPLACTRRPRGQTQGPRCRESWRAALALGRAKQQQRLVMPFPPTLAEPE